MRWIVPIVLTIALPVLGQGPGKGKMAAKMMPNYDVSKETTFKGTVEEVVPMKMGMMAGIHLKVKTAEKTVDVHLGPSAYLDEKHIKFAPGDAVEVTAAPAPMGMMEGMIARKIVRGNETFVFRNERGVPEWAGTGIGRTPAAPAPDEHKH